CRGTVSRRVALNQQMGLGHEHFDEELGGWTSNHRISESNHRQFYGHWARMMEAEDWTALSRPAPLASAAE
ncbi:MAG TPA: hypothetical protein VM782_16095, partial [Stellaceae bacterium]|nr:hypothetical protein [Stellaceae bacterium]